MNTTYGLVALFALIVAGGFLYTLRPQPELTLNITPPVPTPSPIDNTIPFPPRPSPTPDIPAVTSNVPVTLKTTKGDITLTLHGADAPRTVGNFMKLAQDNFYDGTTFHRVIPDFMIQGGDPFSRDPALRARHGTGGPGYTFPDEPNARHVVRGVIAMANAGPNTNGSQFFLVVGPAFPHLDGKHTVFGEVTAGLDIADAISRVPRDERDNPTEPVTITDIIVPPLPTPTPPPLQPLPQ